MAYENNTLSLEKMLLSFMAEQDPMRKAARIGTMK